MTNLSQWFLLSEQTPWEVGVYEVFSGTTKGFSYWDGADFQEFHLTPERAAAGYAAGLRATQKWWPISTMWRGLSTNPEVKKKQGNKRVTRYVVIDRGGFIDKPVAVFSSKKLAEEYGSKLFAATVKTIRFRTTE